MVRKVLKFVTISLNPDSIFLIYIKINDHKFSTSPFLEALLVERDFDQLRDRDLESLGRRESCDSCDPDLPCGVRSRDLDRDTLLVSL